MHVEEVDARSAPDETLAIFAAAERACAPELWPGEPLRESAEIVAHFRHQPATHTSCQWLCGDAFASLNVHGPTAAFVQLLVPPEERRRGRGSALLERVVARCRELGVSALHASHTTSAGAAFAKRRGFVDNQRIVRSLLDLRGVELPQPYTPEGWQLVTWLGRVPDEHLAAYVVARSAMDDAPAPETMEFPAWTGEKVRASEESLARRDREMRLTVALHRSGEIGAFTELRVSRGSRLGFTDDTGTVAARRGLGLARAVKLESLRLLRRDHPELEVVSTSNAEKNAVMRHINETIGFRRSFTETMTSLALG